MQFEVGVHGFDSGRAGNNNPGPGRGDVPSAAAIVRRHIQRSLYLLPVFFEGRDIRLFMTRAAVEIAEFTIRIADIGRI